jgi:hypothetical protein
MRLITLAFLTVLVAEMGDRTQLYTFMLSAESNAPLYYFFRGWLCPPSNQSVGGNYGQLAIQTSVFPYFRYFDRNKLSIGLDRFVVECG